MATKTTKKAAPVQEAVVTETKKTVSKEAAKAEAVKAEAVKEAKAAPAKKEEKTKEPVTSVIFEFADKKVAAKELLAKAKESFAAAHKDVVVKEMNLYINANDGYAYLVVNGTEYPEDKIEL